MTVRRFELTDETLREGDARAYHTHAPEERLRLLATIHEVTGISSFSLGTAVTNVNERDTLRLFHEACADGSLPGDAVAHVFGWYQIDDAAVALFADLPPEARARVSYDLVACASEAIARPQDAAWLLQETGARGDPRTVSTEWLLGGLSRAYRDRLVAHRKLGLGHVSALIVDAFRATETELETFAHAARDAGVLQLRLHDTVGVATPGSVSRRLAFVRARFPEMEIIVHFHNDFGLATANTLTAFEVGADGADVSVNGIGNRAGNASTAEVIMALRVLLGVVLPRVTYERLTELSRTVERYYAMPISPHAPVTGRLLNVDEASGRTHLMETEATTTYLPYAPAMVGATMEAAHAPGSGKAAVALLLDRSRSRLLQAGVLVDDDLVERAFAWVSRERSARALCIRPRLAVAIEDFERTLRESYVLDSDVIASAIATRGRFE